MLGVWVKKERVRDGVSVSISLEGKTDGEYQKTIQQLAENIDRGMDYIYGIVDKAQAGELERPAPRLVASTSVETEPKKKPAPKKRATKKKAATKAESKLSSDPKELKQAILDFAFTDDEAAQEKNIVSQLDGAELAEGKKVLAQKYIVPFIKEALSLTVKEFNALPVDRLQVLLTALSAGGKS